MPPLLKLNHQAAYRDHYIQSLCSQYIETHDGIRVYFHPKSFEHAFFENSSRKRSKDRFLKIKSQRMDWIGIGLADPSATCLQGWLPHRKIHTLKRRVTVVHDFVIVIDLSKTQSGNPKANFVTCYTARNNASRIRKAPEWTWDAFTEQLRINGR